MPAMQLNLYELIFKTFLGVSHCRMGGGWGCITGEFTHDFIFTLFLPHVILAVFFYLVFKGLGHSGLESLLGIGGYIFIVQMGWYPIFASLTLWWLVLTIGMGVYFFIVGKIFPAAKTGSLFSAGKSVGGLVKKMKGRGMSTAQIKQEIRRKRDEAYKKGNKTQAVKYQKALNSL